MEGLPARRELLQVHALPLRQLLPQRLPSGRVLPVKIELLDLDRPRPQQSQLPARVAPTMLRLRSGRQAKTRRREREHPIAPLTHAHLLTQGGKLRARNRTRRRPARSGRDSYQGSDSAANGSSNADLIAVFTSRTTPAASRK